MPEFYMHRLTLQLLFERATGERLEEIEKLEPEQGTVKFIEMGMGFKMLSYAGVKIGLMSPNEQHTFMKYLTAMITEMKP